MSKQYVFKGVRWHQPVMTWKEFGQYMKMTKGEGTALDPNRKVFEETMDRWYESGVLGEVYKFALKPYEPGLWAKLRNRWMAWRNKVDLADPISNLDLEEVARVNADFMLLNAKWIGNLMVMHRSLELSGTLMANKSQAQSTN